jgi:hypothetical protein
MVTKFMPRTCTVCNRLNRETIERALLGGEPFRHIAARTGTSTGALQRHKEHLPKQLAKTHEAQELVRAGSLMAGIEAAHDRSERLYESAEGILTRAEAAGDSRTALQAIRSGVDILGSARGYLELYGKVTGAFSDAAQINVELVSPAFVVVQAGPNQARSGEADVVDIGLEPDQLR